MRRVLLGVNIDHVATLREARGTTYPEPVQAALLAEQAGADGITVHLREDRRHIKDRDVALLVQSCQTRVNLEMAATREMVAIAQRLRPAHCCLVPERREELTTEGGLDVLRHEKSLADVCARLTDAGIQVSLFIDPEPGQIEAAVRTGVPAIELHTGHYAHQPADSAAAHSALAVLAQAAAQACEAGLIVNAGHGLHYHNTLPVAALPVINELNIGHAIIARAVLTGLEEAVQTMRSQLDLLTTLGNG